MFNRSLFSSQTPEWATPESLYKELDAEFGPFTFDPCPLNGLWDGLSQQWCGKVFVNPPYGRTIGKWVQKAYESSKDGATVVCLLPSRTDTAWWHDYVMKAEEIRFIRGRLKFGGASTGAPFPSAVVIFKP